MVERYVRDVEVASSNLVTSTIEKGHPFGCPFSMVKTTLDLTWSMPHKGALTQVRFPRAERDELARSRQAWEFSRKARIPCHLGTHLGVLFLSPRRHSTRLGQCPTRGGFDASSVSPRRARRACSVAASVGIFAQNANTLSPGRPNGRLFSRKILPQIAIYKLDYLTEHGFVLAAHIHLQDMSTVWYI